MYNDVTEAASRGLFHVSSDKLIFEDISEYILKPKPFKDLPSIGDDMMLADLLGLKKQTVYWLANPYIQRNATPSGRPSKRKGFYRVSKKVKKYHQPLDGGPKEAVYRYFQIPLGELRYTQDRILSKILNKIEFPDYIVGFIKGKSALDAAKKHCNKKIVLSIDLKDYFRSITEKHITKAIIEELNYPPKVARLISDICTFRYWLPQGAPTSPVLANLVGYNCYDRKVKALADEYNFVYTRYADDLTFSTDEEYPIDTYEKALVPNEKGEKVEVFIPRSKIDEFYTKLRDILNKERFKINEKKTKTYRASNRKYVLGVVVNTVPNILKHKYNVLKAIVHNLKYNSIKHEASKTGRTEEQFLSWLKGNINYLKQVNPPKGSKLMDEFLDVLIAHGKGDHNIEEINFVD